MARRKLSKKQRRFFSKRSRSRASSNVRSSFRRRRSGGGGGLRSWLPLTTSEHISAGLTGASAPVVMGFVRPYSDQWLSFAGDYKDELATYAVGAVAHKFGSGLVKDMGKDYARLAVFSAANQLASPYIAGMSGNNGTLASTSGITMLN